MRPQSQKSQLPDVTEAWVMPPISGQAQSSDRCCSTVVSRTVVSPDLPGECSRSVHDTCPEHVGRRPSLRSTSSPVDLPFAPLLRSLIQ